MPSARHGQVSIQIDAPPETVWDLLADVERMGEWSPECYESRWLEGATSPARPGARFKGRNKAGFIRWSMTCEVQTADRPSEVSWSTVRGGKEIVRWSYQMRPIGTGTDLTESFHAVRWPLDVWFFEDVVFRHRNEQRDEAMRTTLSRIKEAAEKVGSVRD